MEQRLWVEKYRPSSLDQLDYNQSLVPLISKLVSTEDFPHLLLYGPNGGGKRTLTKCILNELYGSGAQKVKTENKEFKASASTSVECVTYSSNYHLEVNPSDADSHDKVIVQHLIKEVASSNQLDRKQQKSFKVVVIHECDQLTKEAQAGLRRTMEKYMGTCRIIFHCENLSKVIQPVRSRCLQIRVPSPEIPQCATVLSKIAAQEGQQLPEKLALKIAAASQRNMRKAIMILQTCSLSGKALTENSPIHLPEYEKYTKDIVQDTLKEQSPKQLRSIRTKFYELLVKGITPDVIFVILTKEFLRNVSDNIKPEIIRFAVLYDSRCKAGSKAIMHLEAFIARCMYAYKKPK